MRRFSFGTFLADDANREAFETCRSIANLSYRGGLPVVIQGPEGFGKTHLLYAIVNRVRGGSAKTGIALVTADDFPQEVRNLIHHPRPIQLARNAILLVDDLQRFVHDTEALGGLIALFLKHGHTVAVTTAVPPEELTNLPATLRQLVEQGHIVATRQTSRVASALDDIPDVDEALQIQRESRDARRQWEETQAELEQTREDLEHLRSENSLLKVSAREVGPLRERIEALQDRLDEFEAGNDGPSAPEFLPDPPSREHGNAILEKAAALLEEVQESRSRLAEMRQQTVSTKPERTVESSLVAHPAEHGLAELRAELDQRRRECEGLHERLAQRRDERTALDEELRQLRMETEHMRGSVARANQEREEARRQARSAFEKLERYESGMSELRREMDELRALQQARASAESQAAMTATRQEAAALADGLRNVQASFIAGLRSVDEMTQRIDMLVSDLAEQLPEVPDPATATPRSAAPIDRGVEEPFVPGLGAAIDLADHAGNEVPNIEPFSPIRRSLHHVEELGNVGLFSDTDDENAAI